MNWELVSKIGKAALRVLVRAQPDLDKVAQAGDQVLDELGKRDHNRPSGEQGADSGKCKNSPPIPPESQ